MIALHFRRYLQLPTVLQLQTHVAFAVAEQGAALMPHGAAGLPLQPLHGSLTAEISLHRTAAQRA